MLYHSERFLEFLVPAVEEVLEYVGDGGHHFQQVLEVGSLQQRLNVLPIQAMQRSH